MPIRYTVKEGDTLNKIAQSYGFSNYKKAGISAPSGNPDLIRVGEEIEIPNYSSDSPSTINTGSPVVSSNDRRDEFNQLSGEIDERELPDDADPGDSGSGVTPDDSRDDPTSEDYETGDPVYDAYLKERNRVQNEAKAWADDQAAAIEKLLPQTLDLIDAEYRASKADITATYRKLIDTQKRINEIDIARVKAYGVQGGGQYMPLEFTSAVSSREKEHAGEIAKLNNERNALIARARAARREGRVNAMRDQLEDLREVEKQMRERTSQLLQDVTERFEIITAAREKKEQERLEAVNKAKQAAVFKYLGSFEEAEDPEAQDQIVRNIIKDSGGILSENDYYDVYSSFVTASNEAADEELDRRKKELDIEKKEADIDNVQNTIFNRNRDTDSKIENRGDDDEEANIYADINEAFTIDNEDGNPVVGDDGYANPQFFNEVMTAAKEDGVDRANFLAEYGFLVNTDPDRIKDYKLTAEEENKLLGL